jgi:hypothetical protein
METAHLITDLCDILWSLAFRHRSTFFAIRWTWRRRVYPIKHWKPGVDPIREDKRTPDSPDSSRFQDLPDEHGMDGRITPDLRPSGSLLAQATHTLHQIRSKEEEMEYSKG